MFQSVFLGFRSHVDLNFCSHFTLFFFSFLTSNHTSSSIRWEINRLTEATVTNLHSCVWLNCMCVHEHVLHTCTHVQPSGDSNLFDTVFGKYQRKLFQGFTFLAEVHIRDLNNFQSYPKNPYHLYPQVWQIGKPNTKPNHNGWITMKNNSIFQKNIFDKIRQLQRNGTLTIRMRTYGQT